MGISKQNRKFTEHRVNLCAEEKHWYYSRRVYETLIHCNENARLTHEPKPGLSSISNA